jgi:hypothetical protein
MSNVLMHYWRALSSRDAAVSTEEYGEEAATRAEQLEDIAVYARAGYFNMGYTVDVFQSPSNGI